MLGVGWKVQEAILAVGRMLTKIRVAEGIATSVGVRRRHKGLNNFSFM
jgi:hypothetical protein